MFRIALSLIVASSLLGCRNQMPEMNLLAPYGSTRVPAPNTHGHTGAQPYYNPAQSQRPASGSPAIRNSSSASPAQAGISTADDAGAIAWEPVGTGVKASAAGGAEARTVAYEEPVDDQTPSLKSSNDGAAPGGSRLRIKGMRVNDATQFDGPSEPARFQPAGALRELSQLPPPAAPAEEASPATVTATSKSSDNVGAFVKSLARSDDSSDVTLRWRSSSAGTSTTSAAANP